MSVIAVKDNPRPLRRPALKVRANAIHAKLAAEEKEIIAALEDLKKELQDVYNRLNNTTHPELIDGCIYEIKAMHARYKFYLDRCKERGIHMF
ncbi:MAG: YaaL family protein [Clostridiales bacterium]|nr:YaaL family protein [Clostridiales bacterium]